MLQESVWKMDEDVDGAAWDWEDTGTGVQGNSSMDMNMDMDGSVGDLWQMVGGDADIVGSPEDIELERELIGTSNRTSKTDMDEEGEIPTAKPAATSTATGDSASGPTLQEATTSTAVANPPAPAPTPVPTPILPLNDQSPLPSSLPPSAPVPEPLTSTPTHTGGWGPDTSRKDNAQGWGTSTGTTENNSLGKGSTPTIAGMSGGVVQNGSVRQANGVSSNGGNGGSGGAGVSVSPAREPLPNPPSFPSRSRMFEERDTFVPPPSLDSGWRRNGRSATTATSTAEGSQTTTTTTNGQTNGETSPVPNGASSGNGNGLATSPTTMGNGTSNGTKVASTSTSKDSGAWAGSGTVEPWRANGTKVAPSSSTSTAKDGAEWAGSGTAESWRANGAKVASSSSMSTSKGGWGWAGSGTVEPWRKSKAESNGLGISKGTATASDSNSTTQNGGWGSPKKEMNGSAQNGTSAKDDASSSATTSQSSLLKAKDDGGWGTGSGWAGGQGGASASTAQPSTSTSNDDGGWGNTNQTTTSWGNSGGWGSGGGDGDWASTAEPSTTAQPRTSTSLVQSSRHSRPVYESNPGGMFRSKDHQHGTKKTSSGGNLFGQSAGQSTPSCTLFIGNISWASNEDTITQALSEFGPLSSVSLPKHQETGKSKGVAFVVFTDIEVAKRAHGKCTSTEFEIDGRKVKVAYAESASRNKGSRGGDRGGGGNFGGSGGDVVSGKRKAEESGWSGASKRSTSASTWNPPDATKTSPAAGGDSAGFSSWGDNGTQRGPSKRSSITPGADADSWLNSNFGSLGSAPIRQTTSPLDAISATAAATSSSLELNMTICQNIIATRFFFEKYNENAARYEASKRASAMLHSNERDVPSKLQKRIDDDIARARADSHRLQSALQALVKDIPGFPGPEFEKITAFIKRVEADARAAEKGIERGDVEAFAKRKREALKRSLAACSTSAPTNAFAGRSSSTHAPSANPVPAATTTTPATNPASATRLSPATNPAPAVNPAPASNENAWGVSEDWGSGGGGWQ